MAETRLKIEKIGGKGIVVHGNDIDTDRIIPARFMKSITFEGLGAFAFYDVRFNTDGSKKGHVFDDARFAGSEVLVVNKNFGCGSSREHAPQALQKYGIKAVVGESFAEIFAGNCTAMGIPAVSLSAEAVEKIQSIVESNPGTAVEVDLKAGTVKAGGFSAPLSMPQAYRNSLIAGTWDSTGVLLENVDKIKATSARLPYVKGFAS